MIGVLHCFVVYFVIITCKCRRLLKVDIDLDLLKRKKAIFLNILVLIGQTSVPEI